MRIRRLPFAAVAVAVAAATALTACGGDSETPAGGGTTTTTQAREFPAGSKMASLSEAKKIKVGTKFDQPLFGLKPPSGDPEGFDTEIARIIASDLGIPEDGIEWVETVSANREPFIEGGQVDIVVATYTINDTRKQKVDFAGPYYVAGQAIMVLEETTGVNGPQDLAGKKVCTVSGSTPAKNMADKYPQAQLQLTDAYSNCLEPLRQKQVEAMTTDNVILSGFVDQNPGEFKIVGEPFTQEPYGIGLKKGDTEFRNFINDVLEASFEDGRWEKAWEDTAGAVLDLPEPPTVDRY
jgi:glutamate transport system substrate-binding protein